MKYKIEKIDQFLFEIKKDESLHMRVPARIYASEKILQEIQNDKSIEQLINVASLPGIERYAIAMPDIHQGYGFPIGGVAAIDAETGIISPGGIGYDINCGVRLLKSKLSFNETEKYLDSLLDLIFSLVPSGIGRGGKFKFSKKELNEILKDGVNFIAKKGLADKKDFEFIEEHGSYQGADPQFVSEKAKERGKNQLGTIGSGNHFIEIQKVEKIFDEDTANAFGLFKDQVVIMIHTGSRGLGHQVCTDYVKVMNSKLEKYKLKLKDRELACAPFLSKEGQEYFKAMAAAANFAWTNRELISYQIQQAFFSVFNKEGGLKILYDVAHNIGKIEKYENKKLIVHRKGATRAFGPGSKFIPKTYEKIGQPVIIPGSMGSASYILKGTNKSEKESFGSCCHGAGRHMSRRKAKKEISFEKLKEELLERGVLFRAGSKSGMVEEAPEAYKDISEVVEVVHKSGLAKKIAKLKPLGVIKG